MSEKTVCIVLADGFEEVEALLPADLFKRLGLKVILAGLKDKVITGAHGIKVMAETLVHDITPKDFDALVLPGGLPGATNLQASQKVAELLQSASAENKICAAICAAPIVLHDSGIAQGKRITGYPGCDSLAKRPNCRFSGQNVEMDGTLITGIGMGQAAPFAFAVAETLGISQEKIKSLKKDAFIS